MIKIAEYETAAIKPPPVDNTSVVTANGSCSAIPPEDGKDRQSNLLVPFNRRGCHANF